MSEEKNKNNPKDFEKRSKTEMGKEIGKLDPKEPIERVNPFSDDSFERMAKLARGTKSHENEVND